MTGNTGVPLTEELLNEVLSVPSSVQKGVLGSYLGPCHVAPSSGRVTAVVKAHDGTTGLGETDDEGPVLDDRVSADRNDRTPGAEMPDRAPDERMRLRYRSPDS